MSTDTPTPAGFPRCPQCQLFRAGSPTICYRCAAATFEKVPAPCPTCSRALGEDGTCGNPLCNNPNRDVDRIAAIAVKTGAIDDKAQALKYRGRVGWAIIFGRLVVGYLDAERDPAEFDLIVANPTYIGEGSDRTVRHTELVVEAAAREDLIGRWQWDVGEPRAILKTGPSPQSARGNYAQKRAAADALLRVLVVPNPDRIKGKRILVYDDICTTALQLDRVAWLLKSQGAAAVEGLVLARTPWRRRN